MLQVKGLYDYSGCSCDGPVAAEDMNGCRSTGEEIWGVKGAEMENGTGQLKDKQVLKVLAYYVVCIIE